MPQEKRGNAAPRSAVEPALSDDQRTRPFRLSAEEEGGAAACWRVTIVWHPDIRCIGAAAQLRDTGDPFLIGRGTPTFETPAGGEVVLGDPHISRRALLLRPTKSDDGPGAWTLERPAGSSRLRLEGRDCDDAQLLSEAEIRDGVALSIADHVLLHIRRSSTAPKCPNLDRVPGLIGVSPLLHALRQAICDAGASNEDVLLVGPTGCGKELVARALHDCGPGDSRPWVPVNMAAIPPELATASLFGARRGAFTGAEAHRQGYFQQASGGTLFLDEIGDAPPTLQPLLLRALQEREVQVVGGPVEAVDVRVISAMERDPDDPDFPFRGALRHRLGAQEIRVPSLADRREDLGLLVVHLSDSERRPGAGYWPPPVSEVPRWLRLIERFMAYTWPGNVRELKHALGQIAAASQGGHLRVPPGLLRRFQAERPGSAIAEVPPAECKDRGPRLADLDEDELYAAWMDAGREVAELARRLGVSRSAVYRRVESSRRCRLASDVPLGELLNALDACRGDLEATAERLSVSRRGLEARMRAAGPNAPQNTKRGD